MLRIITYVSIFLQETHIARVGKIRIAEFSLVDMLRTRELIPPLTMRLPDGRTIHAWDFKQKKSLVIAFLDADCAACEAFLGNLSERASELREKGAVVLACFLEPPPRRLADMLPDGIFAGTESTGRAARGFLGDGALSGNGLAQPGVFVADRYGELSAMWVARDHKFPAAANVLTSLHQIEIACEECYPPTWPPEA